ncbi:MAG TPA: glycoside hydrolase family 9 protein [Streptosporangiaceae bacterium]|nr:glycoside hydrolase family 9 protein [Streptosporangiaceae bacterium]
MSCPRPRSSLAAAGITAALSLLAAACGAGSTSTAATPGASTAGGTPGASTVGGTPGAGTAAAAPAASAPGPQVRINQVGYPAGGPKVAFAMLTTPATRVSFTISGSHGTVFHGTVFHGSSSDDVGSWNARFPAVFRLDFSALSRPGSYRIAVSAGGATAVSPAFTVGPAAALYHRLVLGAVRYFTSERDGAAVIGSVLGRKPANLTDRRAFVYQQPRYDSNDNLLGTLHRAGGPVDMAGGWFDAGGGYEKFAYTNSYADALMLMAARDFPGSYSTLGPEAGFGLGWLVKQWNPARRALYVQTGIGSGNASNTIQGDYNFWFLPQAEDRLNVSTGGHPGPSAYYVKYRPVFEAAAPGKPVSPDLAGRMAADFALGAQLAAHRNRAQAGHLLSLARGVYAMAKTSGVGPIVTTFPHDYYPGTQWRSDMLWGAAEIALAEEALGSPAAQIQAELATAAHWATAYIAQGHPAGGDTLNLYDTGAVGEAELLRAMHGPGGGQVVAPSVLLADLAAQLKLGEKWASGDPFALGTGLGSQDATPHAFGLVITDALFRSYGGGPAYRDFAAQQLNFALGANPWGSSFVVGAGTTFPHCMQSEIANLAGSLTGTGDIQLGATVDGPSAPANFAGLGTVSGMRACHAGSYRPFNTKTAAYEDNVVSWPSVEPAGDYTATSLLAFALTAQAGT